jgi:exopolysaccharide production protein ExoY
VRSPFLISVYELPGTQDSKLGHFFLRAVERGSAALLLILLFPVLVAVALTIYLLSGRAPLIADLRIGQYGTPFWMLKYRTMWPKKRSRLRWAGLVEPLEPGPLRGAKLRTDPRITSALALYCRRHSIDELPQLWHVMRGRMAYVGPRPLTAGELDCYYGLDATEVLSRRPGLTGLWQVTGRSQLTYQQRKKMDLRLVRDGSPRLYIAIMWRTLLGVVKGGSAW